MYDEPFNRLGDVIEACVFTAQKAWRDEYYRSSSIELAHANNVRATRVACNLYPAGNIDVMVKIQARRNYQNDIYFWKWHQLGGKYYTS